MRLFRDSALILLSVLTANACESDSSPSGNSGASGEAGDANSAGAGATSGAGASSGGAAGGGGLGGDAAGQAGSVGNAGGRSAEAGSSAGGAEGGSDAGGASTEGWRVDLGDLLGPEHAEQELIVIDATHAFRAADSASHPMAVQSRFEPDGSFLIATGSAGVSFIVKYSQALELEWEADINALVSTGVVAASAAAFTADGESYVGGTTNRALPGETLVGSDAWVGKLDDRGQLLWAHQWGSSGFQSTQHLLATEEGVLGAGPATGQVPGNPAANNGGPFLSRYTSDGERTGLKQYPPFPNTVSTFDPQFTFLGANGEFYQVVSSSPSWLRRIDADGTQHEDREIGGPQTPFAPVKVAQNPSKTAFFGCLGQVGTRSVAPGVFEFGLDGRARWYREGAEQQELLDPVEGTTWTGSFESCDAITVSNDSIYLAGVYRNTYTKGSVLRDPLHAVYVARYSLTGERVWFRQLTTLPTDPRPRSLVHAMHVGTDGDLRVLLTGPLDSMASWFQFTVAKEDGELL